MISAICNHVGAARMTRPAKYYSSVISDDHARAAAALTARKRPSATPLAPATSGNVSQAGDEASHEQRRDGVPLELTTELLHALGLLPEQPADPEENWLALPACPLQIRLLNQPVRLARPQR